MEVTEVPNTILWIAAVGLVIQTILVAALVIAMVSLVSRVKTLVDKANEVVEPIKEAAENVSNTVSNFSTSLLRPVATAAGVFAGFRRGAGKFGGRKKR